QAKARSTMLHPMPGARRRGHPRSEARPQAEGAEGAMKRSKLILDASCFPYRLGCNLAPRYDQSSDSQRIQVGEAPQMTRVRVLVVTGLLWMCGSLAAGEEGLFPFVVAYDTPANATNVSAWLDRPAGVHGFIRVEGGHLKNDAGPVRFWATNICFEACFPTHQQAERLAARLARLGVNCVRMHHMDNFSIWGDSPNKLTIDPRKLERLDYFIAQLKKHGVYTNLNLHVSRWFGEEEGFSGRRQQPEFDKGLDNFEPRMIELQKKYARDLLSHVNPYTGNPYTREPAIAFVEINNENALHATWGWGQIDQLPEPYSST